MTPTVRAIFTVAGLALAATATTAAAQSCPAVLDHTFAKLQDDSPQNLCQYRGKVVLVVNTASYCGYTPQYEGLEKLYSQYAARGFTILGFPSGDFGNQEKETNKEIAEFCYNTYGVKFPMFSKSSVKGANANALFATLAKDTGEAPKWNFHKYLIDRDGKVIASIPTKVEPLDPKLTRQIETLLGAK